MDDRSQIIKGTTITLDGDYFVCLRKISGNRYQFEAFEDGELRNLSHEDLARLISIGKAELNVSPLLMKTERSLTKNEEEAAKRRLAYLRIFDEEGMSCPVTRPLKSKKLIQRVAKQIGDPRPPSVKTVYNWIRSTRGCRSLNDIAPANSRKGRSGYTIFDRHPALLDLVEACAESFYLRKERPNIKSLYGALLDDIKKHNVTARATRVVPFPDYEAVRKYVASLDLYASAVARFGKISADHRFKLVRRIPKPTRPMEIGELDATKLDIIVTMFGIRIGRPWLTVVIDLYTRMIVGFHLSIAAPSVPTVAETLRNALLHKGYLSQIPGLKHTWPCHGKPLMIILDRGKENMSNDLLAMGGDLDLIIQQLPGRSPWLKGTVERFFRSLNDGLIHYLPGTTKSKPEDRGEYNSEKMARIEFDDLYVYLHRWIVDVYHQRYHQGLDGIPIRKWEASKYPVPLFESNRKIRFWTMMTETRTLSREGIQIDYLNFNSPEINEWLRDSSVNRPRNKGDTAKVRIKYSGSEPFNTISVEHPVDGYYVDVPVIDVQKDLVKDLTRTQYKMVRKLAKQNLNRKKIDDEAAISQAEILKEAYAVKRLVWGDLSGKNKLTSQEAKLLGAAKGASSGDELQYPTDTVGTRETDVEEVEWVADDPY